MNDMWVISQKESEEEACWVFLANERAEEAPVVVAVVSVNDLLCQAVSDAK